MLHTNRKGSRKLQLSTSSYFCFVVIKYWYIHVVPLNYQRSTISLYRDLIKCFVGNSLTIFLNSCMITWIIIMDIINYKTFIVPRYLCDVLNQMNDVYTGNEFSQAIIVQFLLSLMKIIIFQIVLTTFIFHIVIFLFTG